MAKDTTDREYITIECDKIDSFEKPYADLKLRAKNWDDDFDGYIYFEGAKPWICHQYQTKDQCGKLRTSVDFNRYLELSYDTENFYYIVKD